MRIRLAFMLMVATAWVPKLSAQCYTFSSGTATSLTVNITHLPPPTRSTSVPWIWDYSSDSGLVASVSLKVGQTTYSPEPGDAPLIDVTVADDTSTSFSDVTFNVAFSAGNFVIAGGLADLSWSGNYFPNGTLPATLPPVSSADGPILIVNVTGPSGTIVDQTLTLTSVTSCTTTTPPSGAPNLTLSLTHVGSFLAGQPSAFYTIRVQNSGATATNGAVFVSTTLPVGLIPISLSGIGWTCGAVSLICSRSDGLSVGGIYPPIVLNISVASYAASSVTTRVNVSGGGSVGSSASDLTNIQPAFTDVLPSDSFLPAIDLLKEFGVTSGCQAQPPMFCSNDYVSQSQMAVFIVRSIVGNDSFNYTRTPYFLDVPANNPYFPWIQKMQDMGIALPCGTNQFCPDVPVRRGGMAVLIIRGRYGTSLPASYPTTPYFTDVPTGYPFFPWIQKMKEQGITSGCSATTYCPEDPVTRGQMAVFIMRGLFNLLL